MAFDWHQLSILAFTFMIHAISIKTFIKVDAKVLPY